MKLCNLLFVTLATAAPYFNYGASEYDDRYYAPQEYDDGYYAPQDYQQQYDYGYYAPQGYEQGYDNGYYAPQYQQPTEEYYEERIPFYSAVRIGSTSFDGGDLAGGANPTAAQATALQQKRTSAKSAIASLLQRADRKLTQSGCGATVNVAIINDLHSSRSQPRAHYTFRTTSGCPTVYTGHAFADGNGEIFNGGHSQVYP